VIHLIGFTPSARITIPRSYCVTRQASRAPCIRHSL
jgi:hypothetical protein